MYLYVTLTIKFFLLNIRTGLREKANRGLVFLNLWLRVREA